MDAIMRFLKEKWWALLCIVILCILILIPTRSGLPSSDYKGCQIESSVCYDSTIKSITKESDGSATLIIPVKVSKSETRDFTLHLNKFDSEWIVGGKVMVNFAVDTKKIYLFIEHRSNLLITIIDRALSSSQGVTAIFDSNGQQIKG